LEQDLMGRSNRQRAEIERNGAPLKAAGTIDRLSGLRKGAALPAVAARAIVAVNSFREEA
jgi:hypothetical protein